jgi:hypothetical protein
MIERAVRAVIAAGVASAAALGAPAPTRAGETPSFFGGRLRLGGEVSATLSPEDDGYFNYNDYDTNTLRLFRVNVSAEARLARPLSVLGEVRTDNLGAPRVYALYLRIRPFARRAFDLQAGLVPPVFGAFPRRRYATDNPLPSLPLVYQYLTILREDAAANRSEDLVIQRGRGWRVRYPVGSSEAGPGLPVVATNRWDAGVQARLGDAPWSLAVAVTQGTLCYPVTRDNNRGKQVSGRLAWTPGPALTAGVSGATGDFLSREVTDEVPPSPGHGYRQQALGLDLSWAAGYWLVRAEAVWSRWRLPALDETRIEKPLDALGAYAEARYKIRAGLYAAARVEHLGFSRLPSALGTETWDANVDRVEAGGGYALRRQLILKLSWQHNWRDGGRVRQNDLVAAQVLLWF